MKSDWSHDRGMNFKQEDLFDESRAQMEGCKPDYQENFEATQEDESDAREGALKMTLHFFRNTREKYLADKLQENQLDVVCQTELKQNFKNKYQNVFEGIPKQGRSALLDKIYTEVSFTEGGSGKVNVEHEVRQIELRSQRSAVQDSPIKCRDIFKPLPGQDKPIRSVVTKGVAGIGKTISVQKYILSWAEGTENQDIHFIFPLPFRELNLMKDKQYSLMGLLHHFFSEIKQLTFPHQGKYKVLFIFDGLDECRLELDFQRNENLTESTKVTSLAVLLTNLIKGHLLPSAQVWITSRPVAANQIPPECVDRVTEVQGFSDLQKEEYFRKRICDQDLAKSIISHIKSSRSLHIMCHIPVFCWIAGSVLETVLKACGIEEVPKTLTEMYTYFLNFQTMQRSLKLEGMHEIDPHWNQDSLYALGKLAFEQLEKGNLIFYEEDLRECGIDIREAAVHSGICTQIFREELGLHQENVYCFVHLSIQEYLAALYVHLMFINEKKHLISPKQAQETVLQHLTMRPVHRSMTVLQKSAVDKALDYEDRRFDLFLRFLLGLSLESNQRLLRGLLQRRQHEGNGEIITYIKEKIREIPSSERVINLFHCLNELNDHSLVREIQSFLSAGTLSEANLSPAQWSALVFVLLTSEEKLDVFDLKMYIRSDECLLRLQPVVEESQKVLLNNCRLTEESCRGLSSVLSKASSEIKILDLGDNEIGDVGIQQLCTGLGNPNCTLETLRLSDCSITEEGYASLASALRLNPNHLRELDLRGNNPGESGVKLLIDLKENPQCKLRNVCFLKDSAAEEACAAVASAVGSNPLLMTELDLSKGIPEVLSVTKLCALLEDSHCTLQKLSLSDCSIGEEGFRVLALALKSNPSHMRELQLSGNKPGDSGVKHLSSILEDPNFKLEKLHLSYCSIKEEGFRALATALRLNPSHMREIQLRGNEAGDSGVKDLSTLLEDPNCKLERLHLSYCSLREEDFRALASALRSNPSHIRELQLSGNEAGDSGVKHLSSLLENPNCKLKKLHLSYCSIAEEGFRALASALKSNPSHIRKLQLSGNQAGDSGVKHVLSLLEDPNCELKKLDLDSCSIGDEGFRSLASVPKPSALRELNLDGKIQIVNM